MGKIGKAKGQPDSYGWIILPNLQLCFFVCCLHSVVFSIYQSVCVCVRVRAPMCICLCVCVQIKLTNVELSADKVPAHA